MFGIDEVSDNLMHRKLYIIMIIITIAFCVLVVRLGYLQIVCSRDYRKRSEDNRIRPLRLVPPRGVVYDQSGSVPLADNETAFDVCVAPKNVDRLERMDRRAREVFQRLNFTPEEYEEVLDRLRKLKRSRIAAFDPVVIREDIDKEAAAYLAENNSHIPEMIIQARPKRRYRGIAAHVLGYTALVDSEDLEKGYVMTDTIGKDGIESVYEGHLRGDLGWKMAEVDAYGRIVRDLPLSVEAHPGQSVNLTLDLELQKRAEILMDGKVGAIVAMDPRSGAILAMASKPDFDANNLTADWDKIASASDKPFLNRAIMRMYPPGSTFKIITATAALEEGKVDSNAIFYCNGRFYIQNWSRPFKCHKVTGHGYVNIHEALVESCNVFFYNLAYKSGVDIPLMHKYANLYGLGRKTGIDLPGEQKGYVPENGRYPGDKINVCIGQGDLLVTPLQMANVICVIANRGFSYRPHLMGQPNYRPEIYTDLRGKVSLRSIDVIRNALIGVVERGHSSQANLPDHHTAGKTGSAQNPHGDEHAWFIGFAPSDSPEIAVTIVVENAGRGSEVAAPMAGEMFAQYFYKGKATLARGEN